MPQSRRSRAPTRMWSAQIARIKAAPIARRVRDRRGMQDCQIAYLTPVLWRLGDSDSVVLVDPSFQAVAGGASRASLIASRTHDFIRPLGSIFWSRTYHRPSQVQSRSESPPPPPQDHSEIQRAGGSSSPRSLALGVNVHPPTLFPNSINFGPVAEGGRDGSRSQDRPTCFISGKKIKIHACRRPKFPGRAPRAR